MTGGLSTQEKSDSSRTTGWLGAVFLCSGLPRGVSVSGGSLRLAPPPVGASAAASSLPVAPVPTLGSCNHKHHDGTGFQRRKYLVGAARGSALLVDWSSTHLIRQRHRVTAHWLTDVLLDEAADRTQRLPHTFYLWVFTEELVHIDNQQPDLYQNDLYHALISGCAPTFSRMATLMA